MARLRESGPRRPLHVTGRFVKEFVSCLVLLDTGWSERTPRVLASK